MNETGVERDPFERLAESFLARYRAGERPSINDLVAQHPELAGQIRDLLPALVMVEQDLSIEPGLGPHDGLGHHSGFAGGPRTLGDYRILREIGRGGMGIVYEAEQISLGRRVALKVLSGHVAADRTALERFRREAKAAARLHHTNIVPVFEVGRSGDVAYYAMQFIQGQGLDQVIEELRRLRDPDRGPVAGDGAGSEGRQRTEVGPRGADGPTDRTAGWKPGPLAESLATGRFGMGESGSPDVAATTDEGRWDPARELDAEPTGAGGPGSAMLPGGEPVSTMGSSPGRQPFYRSVARIGRQVAQGLEHAHARGVIHRDIKPSNLLLDSTGVVWIADFGLAKAEDDGLTASGDILGTLRYMAPERFRGAGDARADVYALGLTLYELLTLRPAFDRSSRLELIECIKNEEPVRPRLLDRRVPRDLETILLKAMDKDPGARYGSAGAMAEDLRRFLADEPILARRASAAERFARWSRRNPAVAALGGVLTGVLVIATAASLVAAGLFARQADRERNLAASMGRQAKAESRAREEADQARVSAEAARATALAETYRATLSEVRALRVGHPPGWREETLGDLARLAVLPTPRRDLVELRSEAVASIGEFEVKEVARLEGSGPTCIGLDFSPDSQTLVTAYGNGDLDYWDVPGRRHLRRLAGVSRPEVRLICEAYGEYLRFLPDGELAFIDARRRVSFLDASGKPSARPPIESGDATAVKLRIDRQGRTLAVGWSDGRVNLVDLSTGTPRRGFDWGRWDFSLSPDCRWLAVQDRDSPIRLLPTDGQGPPLSPGDRHGYLPVLAFSPDGATLAYAASRSLVLWNLASREELMSLGGHKESISGAAFSPDGTLVATSCNDQTARIWNARDGRPLATLPGPSWIRTVVFSPDGGYLAASSDPGPVSLYQLKGRREQRRLVGHGFGVQCLAFHPRLPRIASAEDGHDVIVWDAEEARRSVRWTAHDGWVTGLAYSPDGSLLATTRGESDKDGPQMDHSVLLWDAETGTLRKRLPRSSHRGVRALAFDPTGRRLASGDDAGTVLLWDVAGEKVLRRENPDGSKVTSVAFVNEGRHLLVGHLEGTVALFDLEGPSPNRLIKLPRGCSRLLVDVRGNRILAGDKQGGLSVLALPELTVVRRVADLHEGQIWSLGLSPDGRLLATGGEDRRVVLRDPTTFEPWLTFPPWTATVKDLAFDASGRWLAFAGADTEVALWDLWAVRDELAAVGLAWDQPAPVVTAADRLATMVQRSKTDVSVIRAAATSPAVLKSPR